MSLTALPIDDVLPQVLSHLKETGALVLVASPGAGKTTRVPPAILDAGLAKLADNRDGQIVVLQPRRVAARAAATRISEERQSKLGEEIGYQVRHEKAVSRNTRIIVCTEGVFLRKLQEDPLLENVACVVFDEFHERNLDSDLALALVKQVKNELRDNLKIVVMSATLDAGPVSKYLDNCPVVQSAGRAYPVAIEYLNYSAKARLEEQVADGIKKMLAKTDGHILAFLPGVGEIRNTDEILSPYAEKEDFALLQLYGDMPLEDQQKVLRPSNKRKVILSTNVAETSITIDGVTAVVDSGMARINNFDKFSGLNRLELCRISMAAATQRAGRAGRTASGHCLRLWTEKENSMLREFTLPEIARVDLSECVLQLLDWGEANVQDFAWFEAPSKESLNLALSLLDKLDALAGGLLTELGKRMARLPLQPRLARLVIEGEKSGEGKRTALCAALLSERDPLRRDNTKRDFASQNVSKHKSNSDILDRLWALEEYADKGHKHTVVGEILTGPARRILQTASQIARQLKLEETSSKENHDDVIRRSLLVAFPDRVCRRRETGSKRALMVGGRGVVLTDESAVSEDELFVAVELMESGKAEASVRQASAIDKSWLPTSHLVSAVEVFFDTTKEKVVAMKRTRFCDLIIEETTAPPPAGQDFGEILAKAVLANYDLSALVDEDAKQYLARIQFLKEHLPELALPDLGKEPWKDLLVDWCSGLSSLAELKSQSFLPILMMQLSPQQQQELEREAPEVVVVPTGSRIKLTYEEGKAPVLAVRIQELFGMADMPKVARSKQSVLLHLLAPNYRVQQITSDLAGFWKNTYADVKKDLKARYPKHSWPDNPLEAQAIRGAKKRGSL